MNSRTAWGAIGTAMLAFMGSGCPDAWALETISVPAPAPWGHVDFRYYAARHPRAVLVLIPSYNDSAEKMINVWAAFADREDLGLIAPDFRTDPAEVKAGIGYYYPTQWSGAALENALAELSNRERIDASTVLIFGFSAGAHFAHRFALWKPGRVKAFVAGAAGWWDAPTIALKNVPALILCGEDDPRLSASREFFQYGLNLELPWIWRSYRNVGHDIPPAMLATAQAFLAHYARGEKEQSIFGDVQTYKVTTDSEKIPAVARVRLPSKEIARAWQREE